MMTGGQIVAQTLRKLQIGTIFSVSGNQILPIFDAALDSGLRIVHMRHEAACAYAAAALADVQNRPGVVVVTAGPGYLAALPGVATAKNLEVPLLLLSGATATTEAGLGGFQDLDQPAVARATCKTTFSVSSIEALESTLTGAWRIAQASVPGPVHVNLPADVLLAESAERFSEENLPSAAEGIDPEIDLKDESVLNAMASRLRKAERPLIVARMSANRGPAGKALHTLAKRLGVKPVIAESPRGILMDPKYLGTSPHYKDSDCALVIAPADFVIGFLAEPVIGCRCSILLVDYPGDPRPLRVPDLHTQLPPEIALPFLTEAVASREARVSDWSNLFCSPHVEEMPIASSPEGLHPLEIARHVASMLRPDDIVVVDGGEFGQWIRFGLRDLTNRMLSNSKLGGIGGSIPMALGVVASGHPGRTVTFVGDGAFGYHSSELESAARYKMPLVVIVGNDARWGTEWHLQSLRYGPDRTFETTLLPARYDQVAMGYGAAGFHVADAASLREAVAASLSMPRTACINVEMRSARSPAGLA